MQEPAPKPSKDLRCHLRKLRHCLLCGHSDQTRLLKPLKIFRTNLVSNWLLHVLRAVYTVVNGSRSSPQPKARIGEAKCFLFAPGMRFSLSMRSLQPATQTRHHQAQAGVSRVLTPRDRRCFRPRLPHTPAGSRPASASSAGRDRNTRDRILCPIGRAASPYPVPGPMSRRGARPDQPKCGGSQSQLLHTKQTVVGRGSLDRGAWSSNFLMIL
ncbi:hypothetical protein N657DRAFT_7396 [Parathielavia appendiculata]|uniref:Uncharacterized protein n=1 Tax=Parathielavia appendiculata TaxID=2587402 RepID=A0AAN6U836_9PEZI|nr:hypothetical protein N657DRAFT_7396 [Parathielavia appendiculata]